MAKEVLSEEDYLDSLLKSVGETKPSADNNVEELDDIEKDLFGDKNTFISEGDIFDSEDISKVGDMLDDVVKPTTVAPQEAEEVKQNALPSDDNIIFNINDLIENGNEDASKAVVNNKKTDSLMGSLNDIFKKEDDESSTDNAESDAATDETIMVDSFLNSKEETDPFDVTGDSEADINSDTQLDNNAALSNTVANEITDTTDSAIDDTNDTATASDVSDEGISDSSDIADLLDSVSNDDQFKNGSTDNDSEAAADNANNENSDITELLQLISEKDAILAKEEEENQQAYEDSVEEAELIADDKLKVDTDDRPETENKAPTKKKGFLSKILAVLKKPADNEEEDTKTSNEDIIKDFEKDRGISNDEELTDIKKEKKGKKEKKEKEKKVKEPKPKKVKVHDPEDDKVVFRLSFPGIILLLSIIATIVIATIFGGEYVVYKYKVNKALNYYSQSDYMSAYEEVKGLEAQNDEVYFFEQLRIINKVNNRLYSYYNLVKLEKYPEAVDALIHAVTNYDKYKDMANQISALDELNEVYEKVVNELKNIYIGESDARAITLYSKANEYTNKINVLTQQIIAKGAFQ